MGKGGGCEWRRVGGVNGEGWGVRMEKGGGRAKEVRGPVTDGRKRAHAGARTHAHRTHAVLLLECNRSTTLQQK